MLLLLGEGDELHLAFLMEETSSLMSLSLWVGLTLLVCRGSPGRKKCLSIINPTVEFLFWKAFVAYVYYVKLIPVQTWKILLKSIRRFVFILHKNLSIYFFILESI